MNELLKIILSLSLSGALMILVLLLCKPVVKDKLSKRWQYYIWLIVVARLLLPFAAETSIMGMLFQHFDNSVVQTNAQPKLESATISLNVDVSDYDSITDQTVKSDTEQPVSRILNMAKQNISVICLLTWLVVSVALLIRKITIYQSFIKYINAGRVDISDMVLWERVGKLVEQTGIKGAVGLYTNSLISSPLLVGFFRPCIMLPTTELPDSDFQYTILHELAHYKRGDMFYKWLVQVTICLHWFNPFIYIMGREVNRFCELSCDESVIKTLDPRERRAYGDTLLNAMGAGGTYKSSLASVSLNESKELLKERLDAIMRFQRKSKWTMVLSAVVTCFLIIGAMATGVYAADYKMAKPPKYNDSIAQTSPPQIIFDRVTKNTISSSVILEDGVYYILCDGADEKDRPSGGVTGGSIGLVLVRKDSYASISGFSNLEKLVDEVTEQCEYMLREQSITQDESRLMIQVANEIQSGNNSDFIDQKVEISYDGEYAKWGIVQKDGAYYYKDERVRIFMDLRANNSFVTFWYDKPGTIDLRLVRGQDGSIKKAECLTKAEADEIINDLSATGTPDMPDMPDMPEMPDMPNQTGTPGTLY